MQNRIERTDRSSVVLVNSSVQEPVLPPRIQSNNARKRSESLTKHAIDNAGAAIKSILSRRLMRSRVRFRGIKRNNGQSITIDRANP